MKLLLLISTFLLVSSFIDENNADAQTRLNTPLTLLPDTLELTTDSGRYTIIYYPEPAVKKAPSKHWKWENVADSQDLETALIQVAIMKKPFCYFKYKEHFRVRLLPYYELTQLITYKEYAEFIHYVKDSIFRESLGVHFGYKDYATDLLIWDKKLDYVESRKRGYFNELMFQDMAEPLGIYHPINKRKLHYNWDRNYHTVLNKCAYLKGINSHTLTKRLAFERYFESVYPDSFLWSHPKNLKVDSIWSTALSHFGFMGQEDEKMPTPILDERQVKAFVVWKQNVHRKTMDGWRQHVTFIKADTPFYEQVVSKKRLKHHFVSEADYAKFLVYCRDSSLRDRMGWLAYNPDGSVRLNWKRSFNKSFPFGELKYLLDTTKAEPVLRADFQIKYRYSGVDQNAMAVAYFQHSSRYDFERKTRPLDYLQTQSVGIVLSPEPYQSLLLINEKQKFSKTRPAPISYQQAKAYWYWRLHHQVKSGKRTLADVSVPTYSQWKALQSGEDIVDQHIQLKAPRPAYLYSVRLYMSD